jgi:hypothetical protein
MPEVKEGLLIFCLWFFNGFLMYGYHLMLLFFLRSRRSQKYKYNIQNLRCILKSY